MKKKIVVSVVALLLIGAGAIYTFGSGYVLLDKPTQELVQSSTTQVTKPEELCQQAESLNDVLEQKNTAVPSPVSEMQVIQVSSPASLASKPTDAESKPAPISSVPPAKVQNAGTVFEGYTVTVTDKSTLAVLAGGIDWPITTLYFFSADNDYLGSISGAAYRAIMDKYKVIGEGGSVDAPGSNGNWEYWFAERFNEYRSLTDGSGSTSTNKPNAAPSTSPSQKGVDTDVYADEVITLINQKRQNRGLNTLEIDDTLMSHSAVRAEELSVQYSHVRPNGTKEKSECIVMRRDTPAAAVQAWMDSDPHRDAILNESERFNYSTIGSGCYQDNAGVLYWVITFGGNSENRQEADNDNADSESTASKSSPIATFSISEPELYLTAGEGHQLSIESSGSDDFTVSWSGPSIGKNTLSINDSGYITTFRRDGTDSAKATLTVTAKVSVNGKTVKTLSCKVTVTQ